MNLKPRFLLLTALLFISSAAAASWSVRTLAEDIIEQWALRFISKQVLYDKSRTLHPILREVALSRQLATSRFIRDWARNPEASDLKEKALTELENYRQNFNDHSYFVALLKNGHYYHNNKANAYAGKEFRYILDPNKDSDRWFFDLIDQQRDIHINVNPDLALGITKLWIDVLIRDGNTILGMAGTGLDLTEFLKNVVEETDPGITSLFVDHAGAIQLHRDKSFIDFGSVSKKDGMHKTIDLIFRNSDDQTAIYAAMKELETGRKTVTSVFVTVNGRKHLAGLAYLPEIDWHEITLIDLGIVLPISHFSIILLVYLVTLMAALILFNITLNRFVLTPLNQLDRAMTQIGEGRDPSNQLKQEGIGEIGRLIDRFVKMSQAVLESRRNLEEKVQARTSDLERLTRIDPLTELYNRRGMTERMRKAINRAQREQSLLGLLWIDIDLFKEINDRHGHSAGDEALTTVARIIQATIRPYDLAARWGGDEFLVLLQPVDQNTLDRIGERLREAVAGHRHTDDLIPITVSIGGYLADGNFQLDTILQKADQALYDAKAQGRNCYAAYTPLAMDSESGHPLQKP